MYSFSPQKHAITFYSGYQCPIELEKNNIIITK